MRGVPTKRSVSVVGVLQRQPSKLAMEPLQTAAAPARCQRATSARNAASPAVKYCAPWSHCHGLPPSSPRRVLMRPDGLKHIDAVASAAERLCARQASQASTDNGNVCEWFVWCSHTEKKGEGFQSATDGKPPQCRYHRCLLRSPLFLSAMNSSLPAPVADVSAALPTTPSATWWVVCLCAQWCRVCDAYHGLFAALALETPQARFVWVDVEDDEKIAGDLDVETFPTLLIADGHHARFLGPLLPQAPVLARLLASLQADAPSAQPVSALAQALLERVRAAHQS